MKANKNNNKLNQIDGNIFHKMLLAAARFLQQQKEYINSLNVFPVPDGDTGTNMCLTFSGGIQEVKKVKTKNISTLTSALAHGALMEARGNSGVILSQLLRGFSLINVNNNKMKPEKLTKSLQKASEIAYQGVMKPVEGTILTVSRGAARGAQEALNNNQDIITNKSKCKETHYECRESV